MVASFLDPKNDIAFKKIFGTEKNKGILIHFINDMLLFKNGKPIVDVTFLKTNQDPEIATHKTSVVDILCTDTKGINYIVEMQVAKEKGFEKRAQYYASKTYSSQLLIKGKYYKLKEVIFLAISDRTLFPNKKKYKSDHILLDKDTYEHDLKDFSFTFLELEKFHKTIDELKTIQEKWAYFFKHAEETSQKDLEKIIGKDLVLKEAYTALDRFSWTEEELRTYDQWEKYEGAYIASMDQKYDEGKAIGRMEGKAEGMLEGELTGIKKVAKEMLLNKASIEMISKCTGLSKNEILSLKKIGT